MTDKLMIWSHCIRSLLPAWRELSNRRALVCLIILFGVSGCGEGYQVLPAQFVLERSPQASADQLLAQVDVILRPQGFDNLGRSEEMIKLLKDTAPPSATIEKEIVLLTHEYTYLNKARSLRVIVTDRTDKTADLPEPQYEKPNAPYYEVSVFNERPGGFSADALQFLSAFQSDLQSVVGERLILVTPPPPNNEAEFKRITRINAVVSVLDWIISLGVTLLITVPLSAFAIGKVAKRPLTRRSIFILVNTWLAAPMPMQAASILILPLPNLLAFPWLDFHYYAEFATFATYSFSMALAVCVAISLLVFRNKTKQVA